MGTQPLHTAQHHCPYLGKVLESSLSPLVRAVDIEESESLTLWTGAKLGIAGLTL